MRIKVLKRFLRVALFFILFFLIQPIQAQSLSASHFLKLIDSESVHELKSMFSQMEKEPPTWKEAKIFLQELAGEISEFYNIPSSKLSLDRLEKKMGMKVSMKLLQLNKFALELNQNSDEDIPTDVIVGIVEIFAGALICIIPHPMAKMVGGSLIGDGFYRITGALPEVDEKNKAQSLAQEEYSCKLFWFLARPLSFIKKKGYLRGQEDLPRIW
jgi:hypothetical protein